MTEEKQKYIATIFANDELENIKSIKQEDFNAFLFTEKSNITKEHYIKKYASANGVSVKAVKDDIKNYTDIQIQTQKLLILEKAKTENHSLIKVDNLRLEQLKDHIFFFKGAKDIMIVTPNTKEVKSIPNDKYLKRWIIQNFQIFTHKEHPTERNAQIRAENDFLDNHLVKLLIDNQFALFSYSRNPFSSVPEIIKDDHKLNYIAPHFYIKSYYNRFNPTNEKRKEIIEDYKIHFPQFDDFLTWLIACRFTTNRRTSYTYLRINAGFGKSLLASLFEDLGFGRKINQNQLKATTTNDLSPQDFRNSFILMIDEFTHFAQEMKDITHGMYLTAKFQMSEYVPLYAKVFFSAEKSTSFFGEAGVDGQLADRVSVMDLSGAGKIENRKLYKENTLLYTEILKEYIYVYFRDKSKYYIELGELEANRKANDELDLHFDKYRLQSNTIEKIREKCVDHLREFQDWNSNLNYLGEKTRNSFFEKLERIVYLKNEDEIITTDVTKMYEILIQESGEQFAKTAKFKQTVLDEVFLTDLTKKPHRIKGMVKRGVIINMNKLENRIITKYEYLDKEGHTVTKEEYDKIKNATY